MSASREVVVRGSASGFQQTVDVDGLRFLSDEPKSAGGTGSGPTPYDLLLGALGACTSMTVGLYARKKGWPLEDITVRLTQERAHETDCEECADHERQVHHITIVLELDGNALTDDQRTRLRQIAARCPVHKTLTSKISVEVR